MTKLAGVDGCIGGWVFAKRIDQGLPEITSCATFEDVIACSKDCDAIAVDMPIGLPPADYNSGRRKSDEEARRRLREVGRSYSVFYAPIRDIVYRPVVYTLKEDYKEMCKICEEKTGYKISKQTFCLINKLWEVNRTKLPPEIKEFHPELVWYRRAKRPGIIPKKKSQEGKEFRIGILAKELGISELDISLLVDKNHSSKIKDDDIIDSLGGLLAADDIFNSHSDNSIIEKMNGGEVLAEIWF